MYINKINKMVIIIINILSQEQIEQDDVFSTMVTLNWWTTLQYSWTSIIRTRRDFGKKSR